MKKQENSKKQKIVSKNDQLKKILDILGDQTEDDTSFVTDASAQKYVSDLSSNSSKIQYEKEFPFTAPAVLEILDSML